MQIFEQYVLALGDLAGLFSAILNRQNAPIMKTFMEFRLDQSNAVRFFEAIQSVTDVELCRLLGLPLPTEVEAVCPHLNERRTSTSSLSRSTTWRRSCVRRPNKAARAPLHWRRSPASWAAR